MSDAEPYYIMAAVAGTLLLLLLAGLIYGTIRCNRRLHIVRVTHAEALDELGYSSEGSQAGVRKLKKKAQRKTQRSSGSGASDGKKASRPRSAKSLARRAARKQKKAEKSLRRREEARKRTRLVDQGAIAGGGEYQVEPVAYKDAMALALGPRASGGRRTRAAPDSEELSSNSYDGPGASTTASTTGSTASSPSSS